MKPISLLEQGQGFSLTFPLIPTFGSFQAQEGQDQRRLVTHRVSVSQIYGEHRDCRQSLAGCGLADSRGSEDRQA